MEMKMYNTLPDILTNLIIFVFYAIALDRVMKRRFSWAVTAPIELVWFALHLYIGGVLAYQSLWRMLYVPVLHLLFCVLLFKDEWQRCLFVPIVFYTAAAMSDFTGAAIFYLPEWIQGDLQFGTFSQQFVMRAYVVVVAALAYLGSAWLVRRTTKRLTGWQYLLASAFFMSQLLLMNMWLTSAAQAGEYSRILYGVAVTVICLASEALLFLFSARWSEKAALEEDLSLLTRQVEMQKSHYEGLCAEYESIRRMRHDIAKHVSAVRALTENGQHREAGEYVESLGDVSGEGGYGLCQHPIVDAYLHSAVETARASGVKVEAQVSVPADLKIPSADLICAFGNLLDNAMEAARGAEDPYIRIRSTLRQGWFLIQTENSTASGKAEKRERIPELRRGLGTDILRHIAEKNHGSYEWSEKDGVFRSELTLEDAPC